MSKQENHSDQNDLFQTIEFTDEDKAKLRSPNAQPLDDDYFAKENMSDKTEVERESPKLSKTENISSSPSTSNLIDDIKKKTSKSLKRFFKPTYEAEYNLEQLDDLEDYNQFAQNHKKEEKHEEVDNEETENEIMLASVNEEDGADAVVSEENNEESDEIIVVASDTDSKEKDYQVESEKEETEKITEDVDIQADFDERQTERSEQEIDVLDEISTEQVSDDQILVASEDEPGLFEDESFEEYQETVGEEQEPSLFSKGKNSLSNFFSRIGRIYSGEETLFNEEINEEEDLVTSLYASTEAEEEADKEVQEDADYKTVDCSEEINLSEPDENPIEESETHARQDIDSEDEDDSEEDSLQDLDEPDSQSNLYSDEELDQISEQISRKAQVAQETFEFEVPIAIDMHVEESLKASPDNQSIEVELDDASQDSESILGGATWLTIGSVISRIIGALYVIPWSSMFGEAYVDVNSLYSIGYRPYTLFLAIATAGFPSAIAKQMSYYHAQKEYRVADKLFKNSMIVMLATGLVSALILFLIAPGIAAISSTDETAAATVVIRSLTPALLILPAMSLLRGYFQGFNDMKPTAISQIIEQISRVAYLLIATYAVLMIMRGEVTTAIVHSTFAAFIGALAALLYLVFLYLRSRPLVNKLVERSRDEIDVDLKESITIMIKDSIPFILLGSGIIIAQFIDQITFSQILQQSSSMLFGEITQLFGTLSVDVDKLVMIIVSVAVALASSLVPTITSYFARRNYEGTSQIIVNVMILFSFIMFPAALGMASISDNIYYFFFANGLDAGPDLLVTGSIVSIVLGAFTVISTILQSMNFRRVAVRFLIVGLIVKTLLQYPLVALLNAHGALLATMIGLGISTVLMWIKIHRELEIDYGKLNTSLFKIIGGSLLMAVSASMWNNTLNLAFGSGGRGLMFGKIIIVVIMALTVYGIAMALTGMLSTVIGDRYKDLQERMRLF